MRRLGTAILVATAAAVLPVTAAPAAPDAGQAATAFPTLKVTKLVSGLDIPWDVKNLPDGRLLIGERTKKRLIVWHNSSKRVLSFPANIWASGETGLMGLEVDPNFAANRRIYTCQGGYTSSGGHDVRVVAWRMNTTYTAVEKVRTLVSGFPTSSGRHGGCRLLITKNGALMVGTGDAAIGTNPQNLHSFGGKTLRLSRVTGAPYPGNKWRSSSSKAARYLYTYGHRNVQGLAQRWDGTLWSVEQGTYRDDEVNKLVFGGNYGYNPVPGYNESVPMTDPGLPGPQIAAKWSSGDPTLATSGGTFVHGTKWGDYNGTLAVAALKAGRVVFLKLSAGGNLVWTRTPSELQSYGRLRSVTVASNDDLLITTSNGSDGDYVLRVSPAAG
ncbi:MAG: PQQ-dependent sugar dehydrogenase [Marmoricola sp.]